MGLRWLRRRRSGRRRICIIRVRRGLFILFYCFIIFLGLNIHPGLLLYVVVLSYIIASRVSVRPCVLLFEQYCYCHCYACERDVWGQSFA